MQRRPIARVTRAMAKEADDSDNVNKNTNKNTAPLARNQVNPTTKIPERSARKVTPIKAKEPAKVNSPKTTHKTDSPTPRAITRAAAKCTPPKAKLAATTSSPPWR